ncbi:DNA recombination protein RmuC [Thermoanaerobacter uzonensis DSM 18761]|uniref:DNA recombination protein RmuC n=1 Tax=Thermoanaerobacter uzonensis DSM 18761 TaxID=1123369 RepID=A0A1M4ZW96_9THEO|nr:DNA recombination protein RmuC [Thermoanaerobacter uzonensis]SHF22117.1 DNA recombination protein RmuC [Thermoanaerobacter uzonensis DSM 18761]
MVINILLIVAVSINVVVALLLLSKYKNYLLLINENQKNFGIALKEEISENRKEISEALERIRDSLTNQMAEQINTVSNIQANQLKNFFDQVNKLNETVENKLTLIQRDNNEKLEQIRMIVDEKLHSTLESRLGESFNKVSERLEALYKELGEVQSLSDGINDLKKALTNVKTRGMWGEIALGNIIEDILTDTQYEKNVITKKGSNERVEYAIKLPGRDDDGRVVYLPIDAKFPQEDYQKLIEAENEGNKDKIEELRKQLEKRIKQEAKNIYDKYIDPPNTTDFAIMFLPTESLYAEILRIPGLFEALQRDFRVTIAGPTTLSAILNSLQMGFKTLAIQRRSAEVWKLLGAVKTEFNKFRDILEKTHKKLQEASNTIENATKRTLAIERKLKDVEQLPEADTNFILGEVRELDIGGDMQELEM